MPAEKFERKKKDRLRNSRPRMAESDTTSTDLIEFEYRNLVSLRNVFFVFKTLVACESKIKNDLMTLSVWVSFDL